MGLLLSGRLDPAAMIRRLEVFIAIRDNISPFPALDLIRTSEPTAELEYANWPAIIQGQTLNAPLCLALSARVGSTRLLFIGGVFNAAKGQELWRGYTGSGSASDQLFGGNSHENEALDLAATFVSSGIFPGLPADRNIWVGYSAGGAELFYVARDHSGLATGDTPPELLGIGMPQAAWHSRYAAQRNQNWVAVFNDNDPIPYLPPTISYWQRLWGGLSQRQGERIAGYEVICRGNQLDQLGNLTFPTLPTNLQATPPDAIGQWLIAQQRGAITGHSLETYLARWQLFQSLQPVAVYSPDTGIGYAGGGDAAGSAPSEEIPRSREIARTIGAAQESIIINSPRGLTEASVVLPAAALFKAYRTGRIWWVAFNGTRVVTAPNKKRALGFARVGNDFLRRLQIEGQVDPVGLVAALQQYCQDAAAVDGPFQPPMRVVPE